VESSNSTHSNQRRTKIIRKNRSTKGAIGGLRRRAEQRLRNQQLAGKARPKIKADTQRILHQLQVHQIELELQNEELKKAKDEVDAGLKKYTDLYEHSPAGYFTLSANGTIRLMNLTGASMVGIERSQLMGRRFGILVSPEHRPAFNTFLKRAFAVRNKLSRDFGLVSKGQSPQTVRIEVQRLPSGLECRAVVVDISEHQRAEETQRRLEVATASNSELQREIIKREMVEAALKKSEGNARRLLRDSEKMQLQLRIMSHRILRVQEEQRKAISRELHDHISQTLIGINLHMTAFAKAAKKEPRHALRSVAPMRKLVTRAVETVHRFAQDLRPAMLDEIGLVPSLTTYLSGFDKPKGLQIQFKAFAREIPLDNEKRTVLYRVAQEALVNVAKHARATKVEVTILSVPKGVCLEIADNGKSFDVERIKRKEMGNHLGLISMRERVGMVGGDFKIESKKGTGTIIRATVPFGQS
jgi:PAS domain S-box-containing protein